MKIKLGTLLILLTFSNNIYSKVPLGFESFEEFSNEKVTLILPENKKLDVFLDINHEIVKTNSEKELEKVRVALSDYGVKSGTIDEIINNLKRGVKTSLLCIGNVDTCNFNVDNYDFVLNYDERKLRLILSLNSINRKEYKTKYFSSENKAPALINNTKTILEKTRYNEVKLRGVDEITIGHRYGYSKSRLYFDSSNNSLIDIDELSYNLDYENKKIQFGYYENYYSDNYTSNFDLSSNQQQLSFGVGSSKNMQVKREGSDKNIELFSPQKGRVTVSRGDRIIYEEYVSSGRIYIPYNDLPKGIYEVTVRVTDRTDNNAVIEERRTVYNTNSGTILEGGAEYQFLAGIYTKQEDIYDVDTINSANNIPFAKGMYAYGLTDGITLGLGGTISDIGSLFHVGAEIKHKDFIWNNKLAISNSNSINANFQLTNKKIGSFSYNRKKSSDQFTQFIFGEGNSERFDYYTPTWNILGFTTNFGYAHDSFTSDDSDYQHQYLTNTLGYRFNNGVIIRNNFDYNFVNDSFSNSINVSIPLSNSIDTSLNIDTDSYGYSQIENGFSTKNLLDDENEELTFELNNSIKPDFRSDLLTRYSNKNQEVEYSLDGFINTDGDNEVKFELFNTQIISDNKIAFSSKKSDAYFNVDIKSKSSEFTDYGIVKREVDGAAVPAHYLYESEVIYPVNNYKYQSLSYDATTSELLQYGENSISSFVVPGSFYSIKPQVEKLVSFITTFQDIEDNQIDSLSCDGDGCVGIEEIVDGVYKVSVKEKETFKLSSNQLVCLTPGVKNINNLNIGLNTCVPDLDYEETNSLQYVKNSNNENIYFLGAFSRSTFNNKISKVINDIDSEDNIDFLVKEISNNHYVYAKTTEKLYLDDGENYAVNYILDTNDINYAINYVFHLSENDNYIDKQYVLTLGLMWNKDTK